MSLPPPRITVIDDDESVRRAVSRLVQAEGWQCETFARAAGFLDCIQQDLPDCLILDVHLPGLSGPELHKQLMSEGLRIPVVFITADPDPALREQHRGAIAFLSKPFHNACLLEAVKQALGR